MADDPNIPADLIKTRDDEHGIKTVDYLKLCTRLVAEMQNEIATLKAELAELKGN